jgi:putative tricarboxylic transport membrane protein
VRERINSDTVAGGILLAFALFYLATASTIEKSSFGDAPVGPKALPIIIGVGLAFASLALMARSLRQTPAGEQAEEREEDPDNPAQSPARFFVVVGLFLGYVIVFLPLGYMISTFLFLLGTTMYLDREHPVRNVVYSLAFSMIVYFVFTELLGVVLPMGPLGI